MAGDEMTFHILFPENRVVTATQILQWYADAVDNKEVEDSPEAAVYAPEAARLLDDAGLITLWRQH